MNISGKSDGTVTVKGPNGRIITNLPAQSSSSPDSAVTISFADVQQVAADYAADSSVPWMERAEAFGLDVEKIQEAVDTPWTFYQVDRNYTALHFDHVDEALQDWDLEEFREIVNIRVYEQYWDDGALAREDEIFSHVGADTEVGRHIVRDAIEGSLYDYEMDKGWYSLGGVARFGILGADEQSRTSSGTIFLDDGVEVLTRCCDEDGAVRPESVADVNALSVLASDGAGFRFPLDGWGRPRVRVDDYLRAEILAEIKGEFADVHDDLREQVEQGRIADADGTPYTVESFFA